MLIKAPGNKIIVFPGVQYISIETFIHTVLKSPLIKGIIDILPARIVNENANCLQSEISDRRHAIHLQCFELFFWKTFSSRLIIIWIHAETRGIFFNLKSQFRKLLSAASLSTLVANGLRQSNTPSIRLLFDPTLQLRNHVLIYIWTMPGGIQRIFVSFLIGQNSPFDVLPQVFIMDSWEMHDQCHPFSPWPLPGFHRVFDNTVLPNFAGITNNPQYLLCESTTITHSQVWASSTCRANGFCSLEHDGLGYLLFPHGVESGDRKVYDLRGMRRKFWFLLVSTEFPALYYQPSFFLSKTGWTKLSAITARSTKADQFHTFKEG